jgi:hypothetical protein
LNRHKIDLIDRAFADKKIRTFADLGGIWNVDGLYTFYALAKAGVEKAVLVDTLLTETYNRLRQSVINLVTYTMDFSSTTAASLVGRVDAIFLFDVLLHQAQPDWQEVLKFYASNTSYFLIYNPQWQGKSSVRLLDLGRTVYFENVPHLSTHPSYRDLEAKRNSTDIWQWGVTNADLIRTLDELGFELFYQEDCGQFGDLKNFRNYAFGFQKRTTT